MLLLFFLWRYVALCCLFLVCLLALPCDLRSLFLWWVCAGGSCSVLSLLAKRVCPTPQGALAACTPRVSFIFLSCPLVLLLVVGRVFDRAGSGWFMGGARLCVCVFVHVRL